MQQTPSLHEASLYLEQLDFGYIIEKMTDETYPLPRWHVQDAECCAVLYKKFLYLQRKYPEHALVPSKSIDEFWHNHILHTRKYLYDCMQIFGHYLHHEPAERSGGLEEIIDAYKITKNLFYAEFGESITNCSGGSKAVGLSEV